MSLWLVSQFDSHPHLAALDLADFKITHVLRADCTPVDDKKLDEALQAFESLGLYEPEKSFYEEFTNYQLSLKGLQGLLRCLRESPKILQEYQTIIQDRIRHGIVEMVDQPDEASLPHHAVVRCDISTTKYRWCVMPQYAAMDLH